MVGVMAAHMRTGAAVAVYSNNVANYAKSLSSYKIGSHHLIPSRQSATITKSLFVASLVFVLLLLSVRCCCAGSAGPGKSQHGIRPNASSQYAIYKALLNKGQATLPNLTGIRRKIKSRRPYQGVLLLLTILLLAGDVEPNPGPHGSGIGDAVLSINAHGCHLGPSLDYRRDNDSNQSLHVGGGRGSSRWTWMASMDIMLQSSLDALNPCVASGLDSTLCRATREEHSGTLTHASSELSSLMPPMPGISTPVKWPVIPTWIFLVSQKRG